MKSLLILCSKRRVEAMECIDCVLLAFRIVHLLYHEETGKGCEIIPAYIIYEKEARLTNQRASLFL